MKEKWTTKELDGFLKRIMPEFAAFQQADPVLSRFPEFEWKTRDKYQKRRDRQFLRVIFAELCRMENEA